MDLTAVRSLAADWYVSEVNLCAVKEQQPQCCCCVSVVRHNVGR